MTRRSLPGPIARRRVPFPRWFRPAPAPRAWTSRAAQARFADAKATRPVLIHGQFLREDPLDGIKALGLIPSPFRHAPRARLGTRRRPTTSGRRHHRIEGDDDLAGLPGLRGAGLGQPRGRQARRHRDPVEGADEGRAEHDCRHPGRRDPRGGRDGALIRRSPAARRPATEPARASRGCCRRWHIRHRPQARRRGRAQPRCVRGWWRTCRRRGQALSGGPHLVAGRCDGARRLRASPFGCLLQRKLRRKLRRIRSARTAAMGLPTRRADRGAESKDLVGSLKVVRRRIACKGMKCRHVAHPQRHEVSARGASVTRHPGTAFDP